MRVYRLSVKAEGLGDKFYPVATTKNWEVILDHLEYPLETWTSMLVETREIGIVNGVIRTLTETGE